MTARTRIDLTEGPRQAQQRLRGLDSLRGLAAISVVLFHYTTGYESVFGTDAFRPVFHFPSGHYGVQLFFCISGFVILRAIEATSDIKRFAIARLSRLYPAYFVCGSLTAATILASHLFTPRVSLRGVIVNATMLTQLTGTLPIDGSYWTLTFEVLFYAGVALVWFVLRPRRSLELPCLSWLACSLAGHLFLNIGRHHRLSVLFDIEYANLFVLGMMVYYVSQRRSTWLTIATLSGSILMALFPAPFNGVMSSRLGFTLLVSAFGGLILLASNARWKFLDLAPLVFLGEISYSLYLIHQIVGFVVIHRLIAAGWGANTAILIALSFVIGLAYCLRILVEKPAEHWIKDLATERGKKANVLASVCATGSL